MTRGAALLAGLALASFPLVAACPIPADAGSPFATPCTGECPAGFHCDAVELVCVPGAPAEGEGEGEGDGLPAVISDFTVLPDDVRPGEDVSVTVTVQDAVTCSVANNTIGIVDVVPNQASALTMPVASGDYSFSVSCVGTDGDPEPYPATRTVHVRVLVEGDIDITDDDSLTAVAGVEDLTGSVRCAGCTATSLAALSTLRFVGGELRFVGAQALEDLSLPLLESVGGELLVDPGGQLGDPMRTVDLPALLTVGAGPTGGDLSVRGFNDISDDGLEALRAPALVSVGGDVTLGGYDYPNFPSFAVVTDRGLYDLTELDLTSLRTVDGFLDIEELDGLQSLALPVLGTVAGTLVVYGFEGNVIDLPELDSVGGVVIASNQVLTTVQMPRLRTITSPSGEDWQSDVYEAFFAEAYQPGYFRRGDFLLNDNDTQSLTDFNSSITTLDLRDLETSAGRVQVTATSLAAVDLGSLRSALGVDVSFNGPAGTIDLTALESLGSDGLFINEFDAEVLGLQSLATVAGGFRVLRTLSMPATLPLLTTIGGELDTDELPDGLAPFAALQSVGTLSNEDTSGPTTFAGLSPTLSVGTLRVRSSRMTSIAGLPPPTVSLDVRDNAQLTSITLGDTGAAMTGSITITGNAVLAALDLGGVSASPSVLIDAASLVTLDACALQSAPSLTLRNTDLTVLDGLAALLSCTSLTVTNNQSLPSCLVDALAAQCGAGSVTNTGNSATAPVPCAIDAAPVCGL